MPSADAPAHDDSIHSWDISCESHVSGAGAADPGVNLNT